MPAKNLTQVTDLVAQKLAAPEDAAHLQRITQNFRLSITPEMQTALHSAGVARQFVPTLGEQTILPQELADPIGDHAHSPVAGLTHRYPDRVILAVTQTCDVYCRFCFRRETVGAAGVLPDQMLEDALAYVAARPAIREVILTGGDPLTLSPRRIGKILQKIAAIPHIDMVRLHTRVPVVAPNRINDALLAQFDLPIALYIVVHTNHPDEITPNAATALRMLNRAGIPLLSQSVLLKGVNDDVDVLERLFRTLIKHRVKPYYLHHCDMAKGTGHFRTGLQEGRRLMAALRGRLSGICLPTYILDIPGGAGKVPAGPSYLAETGTHGQWHVTDWQGNSHLYVDQ